MNNFPTVFEIGLLHGGFLGAMNTNSCSDLQNQNLGSNMRDSFVQNVEIHMKLDCKGLLGSLIRNGRFKLTQNMLRCRVGLKRILET